MFFQVYFLRIMSAGFPPAPGLFPNFSNNNNNNSSSLGSSPFQSNPYFVSATYPAHQQGQLNSSFLSDRPRIKLKRTRQRVDAGEPRNTYNSIPSYTPGRVVGPLAHFGSPMSAAPGYVVPSPFSPQKQSASPDTSSNLTLDNQQQQQQNYFRAAYENVYSSLPNYWNNPYVQNFLRMQQQQHRNASQGELAEAKNLTVAPKDNEKKPAEEPKETVPEKIPAENGVCKQEPEHQDTVEDEEDDECEVQQKKARVENIISTIQSSSPSPSARSNFADGSSPEGNQGGFGSEGTPKSKRKQYQPQQLDLAPDDEEVLMERELADEFDEANEMEDDFDGDGDESLGEDSEGKRDRTELPETVRETDGKMKTEIKRMQSEIFVMQQRYMEMFAAQQKRYMYGLGAGGPVLAPVVPPAPTVNSVQNESKETTQTQSAKLADPANGGTTAAAATPAQQAPQKDLKTLAASLKTELISSMNLTVDKIVGQYLQAEAERLAALASAQQAAVAAGMEHRNHIGPTGFVASDQRQQQQVGRPPFYFPPFYYNPAIPFASNFNFGAPATSAAAAAANGQSIFPQYTNGNPYLNNLNVGLGPKPNDESNLAFGLTRKKRSKVTDTRVSKLPLKQDEILTANNSPATFGYPTMVPHQMFQNHSYGSLDDSDIGANSPDNSDGTGSEMTPYDPNMPQRYVSGSLLRL